MSKLYITLDVINATDETLEYLAAVVLNNIKFYDQLHIDMSVRKMIEGAFQSDYRKVILNRTVDDLYHDRMDSYFTEEYILEIIDLVIEIIDSRRANDVSIRLEGYSLSLSKMNKLLILLRFLSKENTK